MKTRSLPDVASVKEFLERGAAQASGLFDGAPIDALHAGHQAATKAIAQLPNRAPDINQLRQRAAEGVHQFAQTLDDQAGHRLSPAPPARARWKRPVLVLLLATAGGAALLAKRSARRPESSATPDVHKMAVAEADNDDEARVSSPSDIRSARNGSAVSPAKPKAADSKASNGSAKSAGTIKKVPPTSRAQA
jgi:hypothetical protein